MKTKRILLKSICLLLFSFYVFNGAFAQIQAPSIEKSEAYCQYCRSKWPAPHKTDCPYYKKPQTNSAASPAVKSLSFEQQIFMQIFSSMVQNTLKSTEKNNDTQKEETNRADLINQQRLAALLKRQKKYNDSIAQVRHEKHLKEMKPLEGQAAVSYKSLDDSKPIVNFNCKITSFKGKVIIVKPDGKMIVLNEGSPINASIDLAPGDMIATDFNSRVKLHYAFEKGGHDLLLGQRSAIKIVKSEDGTHEPQGLPEVSRGNLYVTNNLVSEKIAETKEEILTEADKQLRELRKKMNLSVRTPSCVTSVRGTEFVINVDTLGNSQVLVLEGIVDVTGDLYQNTITLTAGKYASVNSSGEIIGVYIFKKEGLEEWWKEE